MISNSATMRLRNRGKSRRTLWTLVLGASVVGCSPGLAPPPTVLWKDAAGQTWRAPLRTPPPDDPVWKEHPGAGVVMKCAKTGKETLVSNPDAWLAQRNNPASPFRSKANAPLVLAEPPGTP